MAPKRPTFPSRLLHQLRLTLTELGFPTIDGIGVEELLDFADQLADPLPISVHRFAPPRGQDYAPRSIAIFEGDLDVGYLDMAEDNGSMLIVLGNLKARAIVCACPLVVGGSLVVTEGAAFDSQGDWPAVVAGDVRAPLILARDQPLLVGGAAEVGVWYRRSQPMEPWPFVDELGAPNQLPDWGVARERLRAGLPLLRAV